MNEPGSLIDMKTLPKRFMDLWQSCSLPSGHDGHGGDVWSNLDALYAAENRHYHTIDHIVFCLHEFDRIRQPLESPEALELSIWFHDAIYDPQSKTNEQDSLNLFLQAAMGELKPEIIDEVGPMIMATLHTEEPHTLDERYMCDIDLSSFAIPWDAFIHDSNALREENRHQSDGEFYTKKLKFLNGLLSRPRIYFTDDFFTRYETLARRNIESYLLELQVKLN